MSRAFKPARLSLLSAAIAAAMYTTPVLAQDDMEDLDALLVLEEVIVTAQKRQQTIQNVPSSIAAITAETITRTNTTEFADLSKITAGITTDGPGDGFSNVTRIRGIGNNSLSPFIRPSVGIFIDEVPVFDLASAFTNMIDVQRIEILKGPQATLFGKEVSSGAISIFTKRPQTDHIEGKVEATFATLGEQQLRGAVNLPVTDSMAFRVSAFTTDRDDYAATNIWDGKDIDFESDGYRLKYLWSVTDELTVQASYQRHDDTQYGYAEDPQSYGNSNLRLAQRRGLTIGDQVLEADAFDRKIQVYGGSPVRETMFDLGTLNVEYETDFDWTFTSITSYQRYQMDSGGDVDNVQGPYGFAGSDASFASFASFVVQASVFSEGLTQELRATYEGDNLSSILGTFYSKSFYNTYTAGNKLAQMDFLLPVSGNPADLDLFDPNSYYFADFYLPIYSINDELIEEWAVFTHNTYDFTDDLELTFGLRYSTVRKEKTGYNQIGVGPYADAGKGGFYIDPTPSDIGPGDQITGMDAVAAYLGIPTSTFISQWTPSQQNKNFYATTGTIKLAYRLNQDVKAYIGVDRGFKSGGFNPQKDAGQAQGGTSKKVTPEPFDSEFATNIEVGLKGTFLDNTLRWNSAIYRQLFKDFQVEIQDPVGVGQTIVNAAEVEVIGAETEVTWLASEKVLVDANLAYSDPTFKDFKNADCITPQYEAIACPNGQGTLDLSGRRVNGVGRWSANFSSTYTDELSGTGGITWYVRGELAFRDDRIDFPDLDPATAQPAYTLLNASVGLLSGDETWEAVLWVKNLTDKEYTIVHNRARDEADSVGAAIFNTYGVPNSIPEKSEGIRARLGNERQIGLTARYNF